MTVLIAALSTSLYAEEASTQFREGCRQGIRDRRETVNINKWFSPILANDRAEDLIDEPFKMVKSVRKMEEMSLRQGVTKDLPWSDSYWPLYRGGLGQRYADSKNNFFNWKEGRNYVIENPVELFIAEGRWDELSPSEKYDLLIGQEQMPLTASSWQDGQEYFNQYGKVETWMGLCHGWAAASIMMPEPKKKVSLSVRQTKATFYPSDIKGLSTLIWAKGDFRTRFIGGRCNSKDPREDSNGRPVEKDCLDNNPGTWHLAVINQIGISRRALIMDATYDYEVWNQPVYSYSYSYFNPKTKKPMNKLEQAIVRRGEWADSRDKLRSKETHFVVGVVMRVKYASENEPSREENQELNFAEIEYEYDLELDQNHSIIGGEWHSDNHPDFLWVPVKGSFPYTYGDRGENGLDLSALSNEQKRIALQNARYGLPWGPVVRGLVKKSQP